MSALSFDAYHCYSCLAAREVVVPILPLGHKMQLQPSAKHAWELKHWQHELKMQHGSHLAHSCSHDNAAGRSMSTEPGARPACNMCSCVDPSSPQQVHHMLRGRDSPVRNALQDCWMEAARGLADNDDDDDTRPKPWQRSSSPHRLQQDKLLATLEALDLAAERLRSKLAAAPAPASAAAAAVAAAAARPSAANSRKSSSHMHKQRPSSAAPAATAARRSPSPSKRYWIP